MKEPKIFLIHGFEGIPNGGWRSWLMGELALKDVYACALPMPSPYAPTKDAWIQEINHAVPEAAENIFLVGHSLGAPAILQYLQTLPEGTMIGGAVLVSGPFHNTKDEYQELLATFFEPEYDFSLIKSRCKHFAVIHGSNDNVVPFSDAEEFSRALSCELIRIENGGHLNGSSGWRELPEALATLSRWLSNS